jgi:hypothetical protein
VQIARGQQQKNKIFIMKQVSDSILEMPVWNLGFLPMEREKVECMCCGHLDLREAKREEDGESRIIGSFTIYTIYRMS